MSVKSRRTRQAYRSIRSLIKGWGSLSDFPDSLLWFYAKVKTNFKPEYVSGMIREMEGMTALLTGLSSWRCNTAIKRIFNERD